MNKASIIPVKAFPTPQKWNEWLSDNHARSSGIWLRIFKKGSGKKSVTYDEALDEALCFGWIDGQKDSYDDASWLQKFTPRRPQSVWSKRNREHIARLATEGRMKPAGLEQVQAAKKSGRWESAYDSSQTMQIPSDFLNELVKNSQAYAFFKGLNRANTYAIAWRLQTAKRSETREKRMKAILAMLARGEKFH